MAQSSGNNALGQLLKHVMEPRRMELFSPFLVGGWFDTLFLGLIAITFTQWLYEVRSTDRKWVKILIGYLVVTTLGSTACTIVHWYHVFINGFGDYTTMMSTSAARAVPAFFVIVKVPSAAFFAIRAYNLQGRRLWFPILMVPVLLACTVGGFVGTALLTQFPASKLVMDCVIMDAVTSVAADIIISTCLFHGLLKSKTGWSKTDQVVKRLLWLLLETQTPPALITICYMITAIVKPDGTALGYFVFVPKVHMLNVMINVNARIGIAHDLSQPSAGHYGSSRSGGGGLSHTRQHSIPAAKPEGMVFSPLEPAGLTDRPSFTAPAASTTNLVDKSTL